MEHNFQGRWICAQMSIEERFAPIFKKDFTVNGGVESAKIFISGLGLFELKINGKLPDDTVLNPAHSQYNETVYYRVFDASNFLKEGTNTVTVEVGHSFLNETTDVWDWAKASWRDSPKMIADIEINYKNGKKTTIASGEDWLVTRDGATVANSIYYGETYDARRKEYCWKNAVCAKSPEGKLKEQTIPPIRRIQTFKPKNITQIGGSFVIECPEMLTGWAAIRLNETEGTEITVTYGEKLTEEGFVQKIGKTSGHNAEWWPDAYIQQDKFISGGEEFVFEPKFSYKGFKYFQVDGCRNLDAAAVEIHKIANDVDVISDFECSEELLNTLHGIMRRTLLNNFQGKPTDTPVWEKNGWLGDANCALEAMMYNFDMDSYMQSFVNTMADCFHSYGCVPVIVPTPAWGLGNSPVWNTIFVFAPLALHDFCGNKDYLENLYPDLKAFAIKDIEELQSLGNVWGTKGLSDWLSPMGEADTEIDPNPSEGAEICCTAYVYAMLKAMMRIADILGKAEDIPVYEDAAKNIADAFNKKFYKPEKGIYETSVWVQKGKRDGSYRQTSNLLPLIFGIVEEENKDIVLKNLVDSFVARGYRFDTGCTGTKHVLPVLFENGYADVATKILLQTEYPSWGFWVANGADSAWESWERTTRSQNHYFLATYEEALYAYLGGIRNVRNGYESFDVKPVLDCPIDWVKVKINTPKGLLACEWHKENGTATVKVTVPQNSKANLSLIFGNKNITDILAGGEYTFMI